MGIFGWSYPAGCTNTPYEEEGPCELCGLDVDECTCPPCPKCGAVGDPACSKVCVPKKETDKEAGDKLLSKRHVDTIKQVIKRIDERMKLGLEPPSDRYLFKQIKAELTLVVAECESVDLESALHYDKYQEEQ